jgi:chaperonin GroES
LNSQIQIIAMSIKPLHDNIVLEPAAVQKTTKSGIVLPDTADKGKPEQGVVVAVGSGRVLDSGAIAKPTVKVGDKVVFKKYSPDEVEVGGKTYLVMSEGDILAIL